MGSEMCIRDSGGTTRRVAGRRGTIHPDWWLVLTFIPTKEITMKIAVFGATGMLGSAIGVGNIFGNFLAGALRNPSAAASQVGNLFVGAALVEALGILAFVLGILAWLG